MAGIPSLTEAPLDAVRALAEAAANQRGTSFVGSDLRLFEGHHQVTPSSRPDVSPFDLGRAYERALLPEARRSAGAHLTPAAVARQLVGLLPPANANDRVLDPAVGGAAFLLTAADQLVAAGAPPTDAIAQLNGFDIDPAAVGVAEAAIAVWGLDHDVGPRYLAALQQADGLLIELPIVERVVGNPPFLSQLRTASSTTGDRRAKLRERWGDLMGAYTDDAWLFLAASVDAMTDAGSVAMVQPVSVFAARHAEPIRSHIAEHASLRSVWVGRDRVFDAAVQVCGVVAQRTPADHVARYVGADFEPVEPSAAQPEATRWGALAATTVGVPEVVLPAADTSATVADMASATAGFRDQFYGFVPFVHEATESGDDDGLARLVTVGMIDVLSMGWGTREYRFAKQRYRRPAIDIEALERDDAELATWVRTRRRPKLLMATQTRVVEVWPDESGNTIPATPVVSIEPHRRGVEGVDDLWLLAAALSAPVVSAHFMATKFGTAMSLGAMKLAASDVLQLPLPTREDAWQVAADLIRSGPPFSIDALGALMADAYEIDRPEIIAWWRDRLPAK